MLRNLILFLLVILSIQAKASHIVGGEIYYDYLGGNNYRFYIALYRDCASTGAGYDDPLPLGVFTGTGIRISNEQVNFPGSVGLPIVFNNPCITAPTGICTERAIYTVILNLPPSVSGYIIAYQRCCRGPNITNLSNPDDTGLTIKAIIPPGGQNHYINSSARFVNYPPLVICNNENLVFDHSATDPDGDSLSYELVTPHAGANSGNPAPTPIPNPPYPDVAWAGGAFNESVPLGPGSTTTINPVTGQLFVDANNLGLYVVGIRVNEWRNGEIISHVTRDFLFRVVNCNVQLSAVVTEQEDTPGFISYCQGLSFTFDNQSFGTSNFYWDFGVPGITTDNSTAFEPTYVYPQPGTYHVMLVANPGWPCTDTTYIDLILENPFSVDFSFIDSTCFIDNTLDFQSHIINGPPTTQFQWNFGPNATPPTSTAAGVNVAFSSAANNVVTLIGTYSVCADTVTKPVFFFDKPDPQVGFQTDHECVGYTQTFANNSTGSNSFFWDFGVPGITTDVSTAVSPTYTFPAEGTYPIMLIATSGPNCTDTMIQNITIYEPLQVSFTHNDSLCVTDNSFDFVGTVTGPAITTYSWNFGNQATPSDATTLNVNNVVFDDSGIFPVTLTASFLNCAETASSNIFIFSVPTVGFMISDELKCEPYPAHFINLSHYEAPLLYSWNFGDGGTSTEESPVHIYYTAGTYSVELTIISTIGCVDTFTLLQQDLVTIHPKPIAGFSVDKTETTICDSKVQFTDLSQGANQVSYFFDDYGAGSSDPNPGHTYFSDGMHYPTQIVFNQFGCSDTTFQSIAIEPFVIYVPNTFTPDGNEFNNDFYPKLALEPVEWDMKIFNRWGEEVYRSTDYLEKWDGTFTGLPCKNDVYSYVIRYVSCAPYANAEVITGHVNLMR